MLCLAALHGMVALVGSEGDVMQVKKTKKQSTNGEIYMCAWPQQEESTECLSLPRTEYMLVIMVILGFSVP